MISADIFYWVILIAFYVLFCALQMFLAQSPKLYMGLLLPLASLVSLGFFFWQSLQPTDTPNMGVGMGLLAGLILLATSLVILIYAKIKKRVEQRDQWQ